MIRLPSMALRVARSALLRRPPGEALPGDPEAYGLPLAEPAARERTAGIFRNFFAGLEVALRRPWSPPRALASVPPLFQPFYWEGTAMGECFARAFSLRRLPCIERGTFLPDGPYALMKAVGIGFSIGFLSPGDGGAIARAAGAIGNLGPLVPDGYGFCQGLFRWRGSPSSTLEDLGRIDGIDRFAAANGLGRSLWFRFMDRPREGIEAVREAGEDAPALLGGMGLAAAFTFPDALDRAYGVADGLEGDERRAFVKGMRIALFVRARDGAAFQEEQVARLPDPLAGRARSDLAVALDAHERTHAAADYIHRFHDCCLEQPEAAR